MARVVWVVDKRYSRVGKVGWLSPFGQDSHTSLAMCGRLSEARLVGAPAVSSSHLVLL